MASLLLFSGRFGAPAKGADTRPLAALGGRFLSLEGGCSAPPSPAAMLIDAEGNPSESPLARFSEAEEVCCRLDTAASDLKRAISCPFLTPVTSSTSISPTPAASPAISTSPVTPEGATSSQCSPPRSADLRAAPSEDTSASPSHSPSPRACTCKGVPPRGWQLTSWHTSSALSSHSLRRSQDAPSGPAAPGSAHTPAALALVLASAPPALAHSRPPSALKPGSANPPPCPKVPSEKNSSPGALPPGSDLHWRSPSVPPAMCRSTSSRTPSRTLRPAGDSPGSGSAAPPWEACAAQAAAQAEARPLRSRASVSRSTASGDAAPPGSPSPGASPAASAVRLASISTSSACDSRSGAPALSRSATCGKDRCCPPLPANRPPYSRPARSVAQS